MSDDMIPEPQTPHNFRTDPRDWSEEWRRLFAEMLGTFLLTFVAAGADVIGAISHGQIGLAAEVTAPALLVMALIYTLGNVSGAHFNPTVTLAFALRRDFPWRSLPGYWIAQLAGAVLAAVLLRALYGGVGRLGATLPNHGWLSSLVMELILTCMLVTTILGTATSHRLVGHNAALATGGMIALAGLFAAPISGASMNPARSFGPDVIGGTMASFWIYVVGPVAGTLLAVGFAWILHGNASAAEVAAALGSEMRKPP